MLLDALGEEGGGVLGLDAGGHDHRAALPPSLHLALAQCASARAAMMGRAFVDARPTLSHMALAQLGAKGLVKLLR